MSTSSLDRLESNGSSRVWAQINPTRRTSAKGVKRMWRPRTWSPLATCILLVTCGVAVGRPDSSSARPRPAWSKPNGAQRGLLGDNELKGFWIDAILGGYTPKLWASAQTLLPASDRKALVRALSAERFRFGEEEELGDGSASALSLGIAFAAPRDASRDLRFTLSEIWKQGSTRSFRVDDAPGVIAFTQERRTDSTRYGVSVVALRQGKDVFFITRSGDSPKDKADLGAATRRVYRTVER